jgi:hypothetical protein
VAVILLCGFDVALSTGLSVNYDLLTANGRSPKGDTMAARTNTTKARQGFTQTPHSYRTLIRERRVSGLTQHLILFVILDETIGRDGLVTPTPEWADLRIADLALECDADRRTIELALADLVKRGMIERAPVARKWRVRALVENWLTAPPYEQKPVHQVEEQEAVEDEEPVAAPPPSPAPPPMSQFIVRPGRAAKPVLLEREVRRVQYHFEASSEFRVETAIGDGIVHCSIFELPAKSEVERLTKYTSQDNGKANGKSHERLTNYTPIQSALTPSESTNGYSHNPLLALLTKHSAGRDGFAESRARATQRAARIPRTPNSRPLAETRRHHQLRTDPGARRRGVSRLAERRRGCASGEPNARSVRVRRAVGGRDGMSRMRDAQYRRVSRTLSRPFANGRVSAPPRRAEGGRAMIYVAALLLYLVVSVPVAIFAGKCIKAGRGGGE